MRPSRVSRAKILEQLRLAGRKGDRTALALATEQMKTLAYSPRYWEKYLDLLASPLARLVDMLLIKQGDKIAHQKGWRASPGARGPHRQGGQGGEATPSRGAAAGRPRPSSSRSSPTSPPDPPRRAPPG